MSKQYTNRERFADHERRLDALEARVYHLPPGTVLSRPEPKPHVWTPKEGQWFEWDGARGVLFYRAERREGHSGLWLREWREWGKDWTSAWLPISVLNNPSYSVCDPPEGWKEPEPEPKFSMDTTVEVVGDPKWNGFGVIVGLPGYWSSPGANYFPEEYAVRMKTGHGISCTAHFKESELRGCKEPAPKFKAGDFAIRIGASGVPFTKRCIVRVVKVEHGGHWVKHLTGILVGGEHWVDECDLIPYVPLPGERVVVVFENYPTLNMHYYATDGIVTTFDDGQVVFGNTLIKSIEPDMGAEGGK